MKFLSVLSLAAVLLATPFAAAGGHVGHVAGFNHGGNFNHSYSPGFANGYCGSSYGYNASFFTPFVPLTYYIPAPVAYVQPLPPPVAYVPPPVTYVQPPVTYLLSTYNTGCSAGFYGAGNYGGCGNGAGNGFYGNNGFNNHFRGFHR